MQETRQNPDHNPFHRRVVRPVASMVLVIAATLLLFPSIIANWTRTQIYDRDTFADNAVAAIEDEAVRAALVTEIVDEIVRVGPPETISIRPLLEFVTATVVDTLTFEEIYRDAVETLHADLFDSGQATDPDALALTLVDAIIVISAFIEQAYPEVAAQLPASLSSAFIEVRDRDPAVEIVSLGEDVEYLAFVLPLTAIALYGVALWVAPDRRRTIAAIGIGWVTVAVLLVVGRDLARDIVLAQADFGDLAVSEALWDVYTDSFLGWATLVGGTGVLMTVAATAAVHRPSFSQHWELLRRGLTYSPSSQAGQVLRAGIFVVVGLIAITQRSHLADLAILSAASYFVYYGLAELIWLAGPATRGAVETAPAPQGVRVVSKRRLALRAGSVAALVMASVGGVLITYQALDTVGGPTVGPPSVNECNGSEELCDRRLDEVVFFGTHNSMSAASDEGWFFAEHQHGIVPQLEAGVRTLLLDTWYGFETSRGVRTADRDFVASGLPADRFRDDVVAAARRLASYIGGIGPETPRGTYLCHSFCELGAKPFPQALREINEFLDENEGEIIILMLEDHISPEDTAKAFISSGLVGRVYYHTEGQPFPTLREMIESDERVVVFADNDASGVDWYLQASEFIQDTPFRVLQPGQFSCELGRGEPTNPIFALNHWLTASFPSRPDASEINQFDFLYQRALQCEAARGRRVNHVIVNFYSLGDAKLVVDVLNGIAEPPAEEETVSRQGN